MNLPVYVKNSTQSSNRGVFATRTLAAGQVIEHCPIISIPLRQKEFMSGSYLDSYSLKTGENVWFPLGYAGLIQSSQTPNIEYQFDVENLMVSVTALRIIEEGEELFVYNEKQRSVEKENLFVGHTSKSDDLIFPFEIGISPLLHIRGLLANQFIKKNQVIARSPIVLFPVAQEENLEKTILEKYYFTWNKHLSAFCLGYGALFNHSDKSNIYHGCNYKNKMFIFRALRNIEEGEELFINYNGYDTQDTEVTFKPEYLDFDKDLQ